MGEWDAPARPVNPKRRRWLKITAYVCGGLGLLLVLLYFAATSAWFLKSVILPKASAALNATITVEGASISPFSEITLRKLRVKTTGEELLLRADEVQIHCNLLDLARGRIKIAEAIIDKPVFTIIQNADGSSNLDPFLKPSGNEPTKSGSSAEPLQLEVGKVMIRQASVRHIQVRADGSKQKAEISEFNFDADSIANEHTGRAHLSAVLKFDEGLGAPTNGALAGTFGGDFNFSLGKDLMPVALENTLQLDITNASGPFRDAAEGSVAVGVKAQLPEIQSLSVTLSKGTNAVGSLSVSGTFDPATSEGKLTLAISGIDRQLLNLAGAARGYDFNATTLGTTNTIELSQGGKVFSVNGEIALNRMSLTVQGKSTPALDFTTRYGATINQASKCATVNELTLEGSQDRVPFFHGALTQPMPVDWSGAGGSAAASSFELGLTNFNLADWGAFAPELALGGRLNLWLSVAAQQAGKKLKLNGNTRLGDFTAVLGSNRIDSADVTVTVNAGLDDFAKLDLDSFDALIARKKRPVFKLGVSGSANLPTQDADLHLSADGALAELATLLGNSSVKLNSGSLKVVDAHLWQKYAPGGQTAETNYDRGISGAFRLDEMSGQLGAWNFDRFSTDVDCDAMLTNQVAEIRRFSVSFKQSGEPAGSIGLSGNFDLRRTNGVVAARVAGLNQRVLGIFLAPYLGATRLDSASIGLEASAKFDGPAAGTLAGTFEAADVALSDPQHPAPGRPLTLAVKLDGSVTEDLVTVRKCAGNFRAGEANGGAFEISEASFNRKTQAAQARFKLDDLNQEALQPLLQPMLGERKISSASISLAATGNYNPQGNSALKGELRVANLLLVDPAVDLPKVPLSAEVKIDGSWGKGLAEIRELAGNIKQGDLPGGSFDVRANYEMNRKVGQAEVRISDLNEHALAPLLAGELGDKRLESVSINLSGGGQYDEQGESSIRGDFRVANLVLKDPSGKLPSDPLSLALQLDGSISRQVVSLRKMQLSLNESPRARQQLDLTGTVNLGPTNGISGNLKLSADSLDLTPWYDAFTQKKPDDKAQTAAAVAPPASSPPPAAAEPGPTQLPFKRFQFEAAIGRLYLRDIEVSDLGATVKTEGNKIAVEPFKLALNKAPISLRASADLGVRGYTYEFDVDGRQIPMEPIMTSLEPAQRSPVGGVVTVNCSIKGAGVTPASLQKNLTGNASLNLTNANIKLVGGGSGGNSAGSGLAKLLSAVFKPIAVVLQLPDLTQSPVDLVDAQAEVKAGTVTLRSMLVQSTAFQASSAGTISLADPLEDSRFNDLPLGLALGQGVASRLRTAQPAAQQNAAYSKLPPFIKIGGTVSHPDIKTDKLALSGALLNEGANTVKGALGAGAASALGGVGPALGGSVPAAAGTVGLPAASSVVPAALPGVPGAGALASPAAGPASAPTLQSIGKSVITNVVPKKPELPKAGLLR